LLRIAFHIAQKPPEARAFLNVYQIARQRPPEVSFFMMRAFYLAKAGIAEVRYLPTRLIRAYSSRCCGNASDESISARIARTRIFTSAGSSVFCNRMRWP
jgi:hypothetical protein